MSYAYDRFRREMIWQDTSFRGGPGPGEPFPDFDLPTAGGGRIRRADLAGRPFVVTLASYS